MTIKQSSEELNSMILEGKNMEAFEKFYADGVSMQENENPPTEGKEANRKREEDYISKITAVRGNELLGSAVDEGSGLDVSEWGVDLDHKDFGTVKMNQVSVRRWKDGKVASEKFYYDTGRKQ